MSTNEAAIPSERDIDAVEERLVALWEQLSPAEQTVLDMIVGAGLTAMAADDTAAFSMVMHNPEMARDYIRTRTAELHAEYRKAATGPDAPDAPRTARRRWDLRVLRGWFQTIPPTTQPG